MEKKIILVFGIIFIIAAAIASILLLPLLFLPVSSSKRTVVSNFEECVKAGNPIMESYPRQCRDPTADQTFIEQIEDSWRLDRIILMQHESEGSYGCFGCSTPQEGPAMCVDPIQAMKQVEETPQRYCNSDVEVVESEGTGGKAMPIPEQETTKE